MCRHLAYVGPPIALADPLWHASHALVHQARTPKHQLSGPDNPDGYGVAWYQPGSAIPHRYRTATRMWDDAAFAETILDVRSPAFVGAARLASPGAPIEAEGNAPFVSGPWSFSLNGFVADFVEGARDTLRATITPRRLAGIEGHADTEVLFAMVLDRMDAGATARDAAADTIAATEAVSGGRLNLILHDGATIVATAVGNSLFAMAGWVSSEPVDDDPAWTAVPDRTLVTCVAGAAPRTESLR
ncbi:MAG: class II glutamine amidotransferase [Acidimicrobiia bacterium]|jgi:glutamine amidotransferase